jgi:hypothetical protein
MYPLAQAKKPTETRFFDPGTKRFPTLPTYDERYFKDIWEIVSTEPVRPRDKVMMGMLASIGIEPGKPFNPDAKTKKAMKQAVVDAYFYMLQRFTNPNPELYHWPDRKYIGYFAPDAERGFHTRLRPQYSSMRVRGNFSLAPTIPGPSARDQPRSTLARWQTAREPHL